MTDGKFRPLSERAAGEYETVAASATAHVLGSSGAVGDFIAGLFVIPETTSPGAVALLDNATSMTVFVGGANSVPRNAAILRGLEATAPD